MIIDSGNSYENPFQIISFMLIATTIKSKSSKFSLSSFNTNWHHNMTGKEKEKFSYYFKI